MKKIALVFILSVFCAFFFLVGHQKKFSEAPSVWEGYQMFLLKPGDDIEAVVKNNTRVRIILQSGKYNLKESINVNDNTKISGLGTVDIYSESRNVPLINVGGKENVVIENINLYIKNEQKGIAASQKTRVTKNITINNVDVLGNVNYAENKKSESSIAIHMANVNQVVVKNTMVSNTIGGIYTSGEAINISKNTLKKVNFGNIVVSGKDIKIIDNVVIEAGKVSNFKFPSGDAITIGGNSSHIAISGNILDTGYCYMILAYPGSSNINIDNNVVRSSVTTGVMLRGVTNANIVNNVFDYNLAHGLALSKGGNNIVVKENTFINDALFVESTVSNVKVENNYFFNNKNKRSALRFKESEKIVLDNNQINYSDQGVLDVSVAVNGVDTVNATDIKVKSNIRYLDVVIKNSGETPRMLLGMPQVLLSDQVLPLKSRKSSNAALQQTKDFLIPTDNQLNTLLIAPGDSVSFTIIRKKSSSGRLTRPTVVSIPLNGEIFWFSLTSELLK